MLVLVVLFKVKIAQIQILHVLLHDFTGTCHTGNV